jgi:hypothetical protein
MSTEPYITETDPKEIQAWLNSITAFSPIFPLIEEFTLTHKLKTIYFASPVLGSGWKASAETTIRSVKDGAIQDDFHLVEHGWVDYKAAHAFIRGLLENGMDAREIDHGVMDAERERRFEAGMAVLAAMEDRT